MTPAAGIVYTETTVYSPPELYAGDAPYQIAIIEMENGRRTTVRIAGEPVRIGDRVAFDEMRRNVPFFRKSS